MLLHSMLQLRSASCSTASIWCRGSRLCLRIFTVMRLGHGCSRRSLPIRGRRGRHSPTATTVCGRTPRYRPQWPHGLRERCSSPSVPGSGACKPCHSRVGSFWSCPVFVAHQLSALVRAVRGEAERPPAPFRGGPFWSPLRNCKCGFFVRPGSPFLRPDPCLAVGLVSRRGQGWPLRFAGGGLRYFQATP